MAAELGKGGPDIPPQPSGPIGPNGGSLAEQPGHGIPDIYTAKSPLFQLSPAPIYSDVDSRGFPISNYHVEPMEDDAYIGGVPKDVFSSDKEIQMVPGKSTRPVRVRLTDDKVEVTTRDMRVYYKAKRDQTGILTLNINVYDLEGNRDTDLHAAQLVGETLRYFEEKKDAPITMIMGEWERTKAGGRSDNLDAYRANLASLGKEPGDITEEDKNWAAGETWTGRVARSHGYVPFAVSDPLLEDHDPEGRVQAKFIPELSKNGDPNQETKLGGPGTPARWDLPSGDEGAEGSEVMDLLYEPVRELQDRGETTIISNGSYPSKDGKLRLDFTTSNISIGESHTIAIAAAEDEHGIGARRLVIDSESGELKSDTSMGRYAMYIDAADHVLGEMEQSAAEAGMDFDLDADYVHDFQAAVSMEHADHEIARDELGMNRVGDTEVLKFLHEVKELMDHPYLNDYELPEVTGDQGPPRPETVEAFKEISETLAKASTRYITLKSVGDARLSITTVTDEHDRPTSIEITRAVPSDEPLVLDDETIELSDVQEWQLLLSDDLVIAEQRTFKDIDRGTDAVLQAIFNGQSTRTMRIASEMLEGLSGPFEPMVDTDLGRLLHMVESINEFDQVDELASKVHGRHLKEKMGEGVHVSYEGTHTISTLITEGDTTEGTTHEIALFPTGDPADYGQRPEVRMVIDAETGEIQHDGLLQTQRLFDEAKNQMIAEREAAAASSGEVFDRDAADDELNIAAMRATVEAQTRMRALGFDRVSNNEVLSYLQRVKDLVSYPGMSRIDVPEISVVDGPVRPETVDTFRSMAELLSYTIVRTSEREAGGVKEVLSTTEQNGVPIVINLQRSVPSDVPLEGSEGDEIPLREEQEWQISIVDDVIISERRTFLRTDVTSNDDLAAEFDPGSERSTASDMLQEIEEPFGPASKEDVELLKTHLRNMAA